MWLFKRKVKRSEWMQGLLDAEDMYKTGWHPDAIIDAMYYDGAGTLRGVHDYCWFIKQYEKDLK